MGKGKMAKLADLDFPLEAGVVTGKRNLGINRQAAAGAVAVCCCVVIEQDIQNDVGVLADELGRDSVRPVARAAGSRSREIKLMGLVGVIKRDVSGDLRVGAAASVVDAAVMPTQVRTCEVSPKQEKAIFRGVFTADMERLAGT